MKASLACALAVLGLAAPAAVLAQPLGPIIVVAALYGPRNEARQLDFTSRLQQTCGADSTYCEAFCSEAFVGRLDYGFIRLGIHPLCRVEFRCGSQTVQTTEARRNETLTLNCREQQ